jgi:hypothetical protein
VFSPDFSFKKFFFLFSVQMGRQDWSGLAQQKTGQTGRISFCFEGKKQCE